VETDKTMDEQDLIISRYTREDAIADGVLVDVTQQAKETGILLATVHFVHGILHDAFHLTSRYVNTRASLNTLGTPYRHERLPEARF